MNTRIVTAIITLATSLLLLGPGASRSVQAEDAKTLYPTMAPLDQYLIADRDAEIALAKSAAPAALSNDAEVLVLEKDGYHTAVEGKNGFTCLVERSWISPLDSTDFWNPKLRGPICYNPQAVRSILPYTILRTKLILGGLTKDQMVEKIETEIAGSLLPMPEPGAMSYMMSKDQYLGDRGVHWHPHLMFHLPRMGAASWGANLDGSPVVFDTDHTQGPEPETVFMVPVDHWSDGTSAMHDGSASHQH
jgi:hypothetical protein